MNEINSKTLYLTRNLNTPVIEDFLNCGLALIATKAVATTVRIFAYHFLCLIFVRNIMHLTFTTLRLFYSVARNQA